MRKTLVVIMTAMMVLLAGAPAQAASNGREWAKAPVEPMAHLTDQNNGPVAQANYATTQWNLDRVDQHPLPLNGNYNPVYAYGNGVNVYVVDSGVNVAHSQFQGRATNGYDFYDNDPIANDCNGHGTHVAGTVAGVNTGGARYANIIAVRVIGCDGTGSQTQIVNGLNWVRTHAVKPAIVNLSVGFDQINAAADNAVAQLIDAGIVVVVAAGNDGVNACGQSPQRVPAAMTVGNSTKTDARNGTSNFGSCLDMFAPGTQVISLCYNSNTAANCSMTGTSMSAPLVTSAGANYLRFFPTAGPNQIMIWLNGRTTNGLITSPGSGSPNKLLYIGA